MTIVDENKYISIVENESDGIAHYNIRKKSNGILLGVLYPSYRIKNETPKWLFYPSWMIVNIWNDTCLKLVEDVLQDSDYAVMHQDIRFQEDKEYDGVTKRYDILIDDKRIMGAKIKYYTNWRQYCLFIDPEKNSEQEIPITLSSLRRIISIIQKLNMERKERLLANTKI